MQETRDAAARDRVAKIVEHEAAAHQKRNWVRLTFDCNDHCIFCLDSHTHNGTNRDRAEIKEQILDGRRKGANRLILSGGEPTIHPNFVDFVKLGRLAGYEKIQTVTNGRLFSYPEFLKSALDNGLGEITFSVHGPNAKIHDALVGTKGAFEEEMKGLRAALDDGRPIVNIDICVNRGNVKQLPEMLRKFTEMGVLEYDLLHVIPFGRAYTEGKETLFYDLEEMRPYLLEAFAYSERPELHIWLNRFPPQHLEGFEHLIQDPYKLNDEVRGRKEEYAYLLEDGVPLDCRSPHRCSYCYLEPLCDTLDEVRGTLAEQAFDVVRIDSDWEASLPPVYGGDPASRKRSESQGQEQNQIAQEAGAAATPEGRVRLPLLGQGKKPNYRPLPEVVESAQPQLLWLVAPDLAAAEVDAAKHPTVNKVELELADYTQLLARAAAGEPLLPGRTVTAVVARDPETAQLLLDCDQPFRVVVELRKATESWLLGLDEPNPRLGLRQPNYGRLTESAQHDVDLTKFFGALEHEFPVENVPACILGRAPEPRRRLLDASMLDPQGHIEIFRYAKRYIVDRYFSKSLRCKTCVHNDECRGLHINYVRAHGYGCMTPIETAGVDAETP